MKWSYVAALPVVLGCLLSVRFLAGRALVERANATLSGEHLELPKAEKLEILPVVEYEAAQGGLRAETGVSYLVRAESDRILFDLGYNQRQEDPSPLLANLRELGVDTREIQALAISHPHVDHAGGPEIIKSKKAWSTASHADLDVPRRFAASPMEIDGSPVTVLDGPAMIGDYVGSTGPLSAQLFLPGRLDEQSLLIRVKDKGVVVVSGCGHPGIVEIVRAAKSMTGLPVYAVLGGLHLYYTKCNGGVAPMIVGSKRLFCLKPTKAGVEKVLADLHELGVEHVYLSPHDTDAATIRLFAASFGGGFDTLQVGKIVKF